jgi:predicted nucleic acid-binding protein
VVDASVVLKWTLNEPGRRSAATLLDEIEAGSMIPLAPSVIVHEIASAISKRCRRGELSHQDARVAYDFLRLRLPISIEGTGLETQALDLSIAHQLSYWDALYLALAIEHRCDLITADARFQRSAVKHYPYVTLLRSS